MSESGSLADFMGRARLFPLPNLVFFPQVMQPLHIFEPRYRQLTSDALEGDRYIAMVLPMPGWESDYAAAPAIHTVACLGRIVAEQRLEDGKFNILLRGHARIRITKEVVSKKLYRIADAEILNEVPIEDTADEAVWRATLDKKAPTWFTAPGELAEQFSKLLHNDLPLGVLCDILAFALPLDAEFKQSLLEEVSVEARLRTLHDFLEAAKAVASGSQRKFPPEFSPN